MRGGRGEGGVFVQEKDAHDLLFQVSNDNILGFGL